MALKLKHHDSKLDNIGQIIAAKLPECSKSYLYALKPYIKPAKKKNKYYMLDVYFFCMAYIYIIMDQAVYDQFSKKNRGKIMNIADSLIRDYFINELFSDDFVTATDAIEQFKSYLEQFGEFSKLNFPESSGDNPEGTLLWEMGKILVNNYDFKKAVILFPARSHVKTSEMALSAIGLHTDRI